MSDGPERLPLTLDEINGRIGELEEQRNSALARAATLAGQKAEAVACLRVLREENEHLRNVLAKFPSAQTETLISADTTH